MDARRSRRSLILVFLMLFAAFTPGLSPYEPEKIPKLEPSEEKKHTGSAPQIVVNTEHSLSFGGTSLDKSHKFVEGPNMTGYVVGEFQGSITIGNHSLTSSGSSDGFVAKLNNQGHWDWAVKIASTGWDDAQGLAVDSSGNAYVTGAFSGSCAFYDRFGIDARLNSTGNKDMFIGKIKSDGTDWEWVTRIGSNQNDEGYDVIIGSMGDIYVSGSFSDNASIYDQFNATAGTYWNSTYSNGGIDIFVGKISNSGYWNWIQTGGGLGDDKAKTLDYAGNGSVVIGGWYSGSQTSFGNFNLSHWDDEEAFVAKVDSNGWIFVKSGTGNGANRVYSVKTDPSGDIYFSTAFTSNITFGSTFTSTNAKTSVIAKISGSTHQYLWHNLTPSTGFIRVFEMAFSGNNGLALIGDFDGTITVGNGQQFTRTLASGQDGFVLGLDASNGNVKYSFTFGHGSAAGADIMPKNILFSSGGGGGNKLTITGNFEGTVSLTPGNSLTSLGNRDIFMAVIIFAQEGCHLNGTSMNNATSWTYCVGGSSSTSSVYIERNVIDSTGSSYYVGTFNETVVFGNKILSSSGSSFDIFVAKLNNAGNWQWAVNAGGNGEYDIGNEIGIDSSGNVYITGYFSGTAKFGNTQLSSSGNDDIFIAKLSNSGSWMWAKKAGGSSEDRGRGLDLSPNGDVYISGYFVGSATFGSTNLNASGSADYDIFVAKLSSTGNWQWVVKAGGPNADDGTRNALVVDSFGNSYITGYFQGTATFGSTTISSVGDYDIYVAKLSNSGSWQWVVKAGGSGNDQGYAIDLDSNSNIYVTGYYEGTASFGSTSISSIGNSDIFVTKLSNSGSWQWVTNAGGTNHDYVDDISVDSNGNSYIVGAITGVSSFGNTSLTSSGSGDSLIAQVSSTGDWVWAENFGGTGLDYSKALSVNANGLGYIGGAFSGDVDILLQSFTCISNRCAKFIKAPLYQSTLAIGSTSLPNAEVGTGYSFIANATGGTGNYTWTMSSVPGLSITNWGLISGTPTAAATYQVTIQVSDGISTVSKTLSLLVNAASSPTIFNSTADWSSSNSLNTRFVAWGDVDGDDDLDLAVGNSNSGVNEVYLNSGTALAATSAWTSSNSLDTYSVAWGDVDGDGDLDLAVGNNNGVNEVYFNSGTALAATPAWTSSNSLETFSVAWGDVDGDGDLDLAVGNNDVNEVYLNSGTTLAATPAWTSSNSLNTRSVAWGDVDGDGDLDLAVGNNNGGVNEVYLNSGTALEATPTWTSSNSLNTRSIAWGDLDGDGDLDLAVGNNGVNEVYLNSGTALATTSAWTSSNTLETRSVAWSDVDGDGKLDLTVGSNGVNEVYLNSGTALATASAWTSSNSLVTGSVSWGDVDGDGDLDLALANSGSANEVYLNQLDDGGAGADGLPDIDIGGDTGGSSDYTISSDKLALVYESGYSLVDGNVSYTVNFDPEITLEYDAAMDQAVEYNIYELVDGSWSVSLNDWAWSGETVTLSEEHDFTEGCWRIDVTLWEDDGENAAYTVEIDTLNMNILSIGLDSCVFDDSSGTDDYGEIMVTIGFNESSQELEYMLYAWNLTVGTGYNVSWNFFEDVLGDPSIATGNVGFQPSSVGWQYSWEHSLDEPLFGNNVVNAGDEVCFSAALYLGPIDDSITTDEEGPYDEDCITIPQVTDSEEPDGCQLPDNTVSLWDDGVDRLYILYNFDFVLNSFEVDLVPSRWDNYENDTIVGGEWVDSGQNHGLGGAAGLIIGYTNSTAGAFDVSCGTLLVIELDLNSGDQFPNNLSWDASGGLGFFDSFNTWMIVSFQEWSDSPSLYSEMTWDSGGQEFDVYVEIDHIDTSQDYILKWELWEFEGSELTSGSFSISPGGTLPASLGYSLKDSEYSFNSDTDYCFWMQLELDGIGLLIDEVCARFPGSGGNETGGNETGGNGTIPTPEITSISLEMDENSPSLWGNYSLNNLTIGTNYQSTYNLFISTNDCDIEAYTIRNENQTFTPLSSLTGVIKVSLLNESTPSLSRFGDSSILGFCLEVELIEGSTTIASSTVFAQFEFDNQSQQGTNPLLNVEFIEELFEGDEYGTTDEGSLWIHEIQISLEESHILDNHSFSIKFYDEDSNTLYSYFSPIDDEDGWVLVDSDPYLGFTVYLPDALSHWEGSTRTTTESIELPFFEAGNYCIEISIGYQINSTDTPMGSVRNLFDKEVFCGTFEHDAFEGLIWDGIEEPEQGLLGKLSSNAIVTKVLDFMDSTTGQIISILLGILAFAGRMVLARGQRAKNKRVRKFSERIRKAETVGRLKIIEQDIDKANDKNKLPRGGYGDLMEQIEAQMEKLGFDGNPQDGQTSGDWSSDDGANEWQDDFQQAADMMWDAQDMMAEAREDASMARQAIEDMQDQMGLNSRYGSQPPVEKKRYERTGLRLSDTSKSAGPSLPSSRFGSSGRADDLVSSILSKNIAPKDPCHCGSNKMYKDCHMKRDKGRRKR